MRTPVQASNKKATLRLYVRQRQLLALLDVLGGNADNRDFQKLLFLYCKELFPDDQTSPTSSYPTNMELSRSRAMQTAAASSIAVC